MAEKIKLVQGDSHPQIRCVVSDPSTGQALNIATAVTRLKFRALGTSSVLFTLVGTPLSGLEDAQGTLSLAPPFDVAGVGGIVVFMFGLNDLNVPPGAYQGEIEITFADSTVQTVYEPLVFSIRAQF